MGCKVCGAPHHANGYCAMHAARVRRTGTPDTPYRSMTPQEQFWLKVDRRGAGECWPWLGERQKEGYGRISTSKKPTPSNTRLAHRAAYELLIGSIPGNRQLDHLCRNPPCVNPAHLEPVTSKVNTERGLHGVFRTHCGNGHELTAGNTYIVQGDGARRCRTCLRQKQAERLKDPEKRERQREATRRWRAKQRELAGVTS